MNKANMGLGKMVQWVNVPANKFDNWCLSPRTDYCEFFDRQVYYPTHPKKLPKSLLTEWENTE